MRKRRRIKKRNVLIAIMLIIILIGGVVVLINKDNLLKKESNNKEEDVIQSSDEEHSEDNYSGVTASVESAPSNNGEFQNLSDGEYLTDNGYTLTIENGIAYVEGYLIVNKTYSLKEDYKPSDPYQEVTSENCLNCINNEVMSAFKLMQSDATALGLNIYIASGYRSYTYQNTLYNNYSAVSGTDGADTYSARPGHSEHQTGLCFDLNSVEDSFANTDEGKWVNDNAYLYGFIIRYPSGKDDITGYKYESWHLRYVGVELATKLYNNGDWITMEEYFGLSSSY